MSNFLAVAMVTETLRQLLQAAANNDLTGATVTMARPGQPANGSQGAFINVFLYQVTPNAALRNGDLPTRRADGVVQVRPRAALDLHYLFSFTGDESQLEPQRLLGIAVRTLHGRPMLTRPMITDALASTNLGFLANSDLVEQVELVKLTPVGLSLEELSKLWSVFFQTPFVLSVAYEAAVVLIEEDEPAFRALPVRERHLRVLPFRQPLIEEIRAAAHPDTPILAGDILSIRGRHFQSDGTSVRIGRRLMTPTSLSDREVTVPLTSPPLDVADIRAGVHGAQVVQDVLFGTPTDPHRGFESNVAPFVLHPVIANPNFAGALLQFNVDPPVQAGQRVTVLLNENVPVDATAYAFPLSPPVATTGSLQVATTGVATGQYFLRVQVDGAESALDLDALSPTLGPMVIFP